MSSEATPHARPRVLLGGWYGASNLGDELVLATFVRWVREADAGASAISVHPPLTRRAHGVDAVGYGDLPAIVEAMADADLFVLGGGGLFQDYEPFDRAALARFPAWSVATFAQYVHLAAEVGVPVAALAQGVGPLRAPEARAVAAEAFALAATVSVRDEDSAACLRALGHVRTPPVAPDPGWTHRFVARDPRAAFPVLRGARVLAVVVRDWPFDRGWEAPFVAAMRDALSPDWACLWLDFARLPDRACEASANDEIAGRLAAALPGRAHAIWRGLALDDAAALLAGSDALLAMRLHAVLLGHAASIPVVALEYDAKVRALGDDAGAPPTMRMALDEVAACLPAALRSLGSASWRMPPARRDDLAARAALHRDLLVAALRAPRPAHPAPGPALLPGWIEALDAASRERVRRALARRREAARCA
ncbi:MAG: hypothetical protein BroJett026_38380 [Betaproteobacteria bacterium]|nr:MAG: hypothetical protein BroJett026_38380 [Betaproteobacteria bacterium]